MDINYALGVIDTELFDHGKPWGQHTEELRKAVQTLRGFVAEQQELPTEVAAVPDLASSKTYMTLGEIKDIRDHLKWLNTLHARQGSVGDHLIYDSNGEELGKIVFNGDVNEFVLEYDYVEGNHE